MDVNIGEHAGEIIVALVTGVLSWAGATKVSANKKHLPNQVDIDREVGLRVAVHDLRNDLNVVVFGIQRLVQEDPTNTELSDRVLRILESIEHARVTLDRIPRR